MATGKSTLGRPLAQALGRPFVDTDSAVEAACGKPVADIFACEGEDAFRRMESEALRRAAADGAVVACGGGVPCNGANMDFMLANGLVVELEASTEVILRRLMLAPGQRPLVDAMLDDPRKLAAHVDAMLDARKPHYSRAHVSFNSDRLESRTQIDDSVARFVKAFGHLL